MCRTAGRPPGGSPARRLRTVAPRLPGFPAPSLLLLLLLLLPTAAAAQATPDLEEGRRRLEEIRRERERLQADRERLQGQVHDLNQELDNLERQRQVTNRIVNMIDGQIGGLNTQLERTSAGLILAQDNLAEKRAVLARRLVDIYKRGSLYSFEVIVSAESFADLLNRSKYLYLTSRQDQILVTEVEKLRDQVQQQRDELLGVRTQLGQRREEREAELRRYAQLVEERGRRLRESRSTARRTEQRLSQLEKDEAKLNDLLASLERARRENAARAGRAGPATPGSITTGDIGKLNWPVDGQIVYNFGRQTLPSGGVIRRNGIAIGAPVGTPVRAVEAGKVILAQAMSTYGLSVLLDHGNGYYSFYAHLETGSVRPGTAVTKGQTIGTVGGQNTDEGPHLYFEIRGENGIALDPAEWLKKRR